MRQCNHLAQPVVVLLDEPLRLVGAVGPTPNWESGAIRAERLPEEHQPVRLNDNSSDGSLVGRCWCRQLNPSGMERRLCCCSSGCDTLFVTRSVETCPKNCLAAAPRTATTTYM